MTTRDIRHLLETLLHAAGFDIIDIEERYDELTGSIVLNILSADARHLIGKNGDVIRTLNHLVHMMVEQKMDKEKLEKEFHIDVDNYHQHTVEKLKQTITLIANRVVSLKSSHALSPMSSYERLLVHSIVSSLPHVTSSSEGEEASRHVVLSYRE